MLLSLVLVLLMFSQFALPSMADMVIEGIDPNFMPSNITISNTGSYATFYTYTVPSNTTATYLQLYGGSPNTMLSLEVLVNGTVVASLTNELGVGTIINTAINATAGSTITLKGYVSNSSYSSTFYMTSCSAPFGTTGTQLFLEYDAANQSTAQTAVNEATTAATDAAAAQTAANSANTAATSASSAANYIENNMLSTSGGIVQDSNGTVLQAARAAQTAANTAANNTAYNPGGGSQSAAYWAYQAYNSANSAANNIVPTITSIAGQNGATCTTGSTFTASINVSPASNMTYTAVISGPGGAPGYTTSGNTITINNLTASGAYNVTVTGTYTPSGKTCQQTFMFFRI